MIALGVSAGGSVIEATEEDAQRDRLICHPLLTHQRSEQLDRCLRLPWFGSRRLALCSRCAGLYPALALVALLRLNVGFLWQFARFDSLLVLALSCPALADWGLSRLGRCESNNRRRVVTGILGGAALGWTVARYLVDPLDEVLWTLLFVSLSSVLAVEAVRSLGFRG